MAQIRANTQVIVQVLNGTANSLGASRLIAAETQGYQLFMSKAGFAASDILNYDYYRTMRTDNTTNGIKVYVTPSSSVSISST